VSTWTDLEFARTAELKRKALGVNLSTLPILTMLELALYRVNGRDSLSWSLIGLIAAISNFRFFFNRYAKVSPQIWQRINVPLACTAAISWGIFFFRAVSLAPNSLSIRTIVFFAGMGFSTISTYSLAIHKWIYRAYFTSMVFAVGATLLYITDATPIDHMVLGTLILLYYFHGISQGNLIEKSWAANQSHALELQALIDSFPGGILALSMGKVVRENTYFKSLFKSENVLPHLLQSTEFARQLELFSSHPVKKRTDFEATLSLASGKVTFWFLLVKMERVTPVSSEMIVIALDVQAKKDAESLLQTQRQTLETSSKLAALGEMAGGVVHEINNPIFVISSRIQLLLMKLEKGSEAETFYKPHLEAILETCDRIVRIVRGLTNVSRNSEGEKFEKVSLCQIIEQAVDVCTPRITLSGAQLEVGPLPKNCAVEVRPVQISQVILNILNNAFDAVEGTPSPRIRLEVSCQESFFEISVTDSGCGIPVEIRDRVMDPFFTTKPPGKGTGLGLSISQGIMKAHQGSLFLDKSSRETRFVARLPRAQSMAMVCYEQ
jgi:signal transduction histidine kinase